MGSWDVEIPARRPLRGALAGSCIRAVGRPFAQIHVFSGRAERFSFQVCSISEWRPFSVRNWESGIKNWAMTTCRAPGILGMAVARVGSEMTSNEPETGNRFAELGYRFQHP
jgi:hypothetical protein